jgi:hypothetical protein
MTRIGRTFGVAALAAVIAPGAALAQNKENNRGNIQSVDWNSMQMTIKDFHGATYTYRVDPTANIKFTDAPEQFPGPTLRDLAPPMYVHFIYTLDNPHVITDFDVREIGSAPRRRGAATSTLPITAPPAGPATEMKARIERLDERSGIFYADVAGRRTTFRAENRNDLRSYREGDLVVLTVERRGSENVATRMTPAGRSGRVTSVDEGRGEVAIETGRREVIYRVENSRLLRGIKVGDLVTYDVEERGGRQVIVNLGR